jgi:hypothetical protein
MILEHTRLVTAENGPRPAGSPLVCFYCYQAVGTPHKDDCVCVRKLVKVAVTVTYLKAVPAGWDDNAIEFQMNDSSSCASNLIEEMHDLYGLDATSDSGKCACPVAKGVVVGDPTPEDLIHMPLPKDAL